MYQINKPKLRFEVFLNENGKNGTFIKRVQCFADSYEVNQGCITFYQTAKREEQRIKIPVLTYPAGKWEAIALVDDNNFYPVFNQYNPNTLNYGTDGANPTDENDQENVTSGSSENFGNMPSQSKSTVSSGGLPQYSTPTGFNNNMPGVNNPQEFKKAKTEWLEKALKNYMRDADKFHMPIFIKNLQKDSSLFRQYKPTETDIEWAVASLLREKALPGRKFSSPEIQKSLNLTLPDIMKRQWNGKMAPILDILYEKEETKNVTAIDFAVWMSQNNY